MRRPLKEHISSLQSRVLKLNRLFMENKRTQAERNRIEVEIRAAEMALSYYRKALELEKKISA